MNDTKLNTDLKNSFKSNINIEQSMGFLNYLELILNRMAWLISFQIKRLSLSLISNFLIQFVFFVLN